MYCHVYEWPCTGFGLMIGFIGLFYTARDYTLRFTITHARTHRHAHTGVHSHVFTSHFLIAASNGGCSPSLGFPNYLRPQLPAFHSNSSQWLNPRNSLTQWITQQFTNQLTQPNWLTPLHLLSYLSHLDTDRTENTVHLLFTVRCLLTAVF
jgi:hypothetical protein